MYTFVNWSTPTISYTHLMDLYTFVNWSTPTISYTHTQPTEMDLYTFVNWSTPIISYTHTQPTEMDHFENGDYFKQAIVRSLQVMYLATVTHNSPAKMAAASR